MQLVICYTISDGYTYSCDITQPIEFIDTESLLLLFDEKISAGLKDTLNAEFEINNHHFNAFDFKIHSEALYAKNLFGTITKKEELEYTLPEIYTLQEWFNHYSKP